MHPKILIVRLYTFKYESKRHATKLAEHIWKLNDNNETWNIKWSIQAKSRKYKPGDKYCGLCLEEKRTIATSDPKSMLNSRSEIVSKCRHRKEHKLKNIKPPWRVGLLNDFFEVFWGPVQSLNQKSIKIQQTSVTFQQQNLQNLVSSNVNWWLITTCGHET